MSRLRKGTGTPSLSRRWRLALAWTGSSETQWAQRKGVTAPHVGQVVRGDRESARLRAEILEFIRTQETQLRDFLAAHAANPDAEGDEPEPLAMAS